MNSLCKNSVHILKIHAQGMNGEGIARKDGKVVFVNGALCGETVQAHILKEGKDFCFAKTVAVIEPASFRTEPVCKSFFRCGGCSLLHMDYEAQLAHKKQLVQDTLCKGLRREVVVSDVVPSPNQLYYRNKIKAPIGLDAQGNAVCGFFAERTHSIVPFDICHLQKQSHFAAIALIKEFAQAHKHDIFDERTQKGNLRYFLVQDFAGTIIVTIIAKEPKALDFCALLRGLDEAYKQDFALFVSKNTAQGNVIHGQTLEHIGGKKELAAEIGGITTNFSPFAFRQVNDEVCSKLYEMAGSLCNSSTVIDAYSGACHMSIMFAKRAKQVFAIEIDEHACAAAQIAIEQNHAHNVKLFCGDCATHLVRLAKSLSAAQKSDLCIVLDPPRKGCDLSVLRAALDCLPQSLIYISCNPATLARDLNVLLQNGLYAIERIVPFDMFANTSHVESLVCLRRSVAK